MTVSTTVPEDDQTIEIEQRREYDRSLTTEWILKSFEELGVDPLRDDDEGELHLGQASFFEAPLDLGHFELLHLRDLSFAHPISEKNDYKKNQNIQGERYL